MALTLFNYNQDSALFYGLDINDLLILNWFNEAKATTHLKQLIVDDHPYYLLNSEVILNELPILSLVDNLSISARLAHYCTCGILTECSEAGYYNIGQSYLALFSKPPYQLEAC